MPAHLTNVLVDLLPKCLASLRDREEKMYVSTLLTLAEMNIHVNAMIIV